MADSALIDDLEKQFADNPRRVFARLANEYRKAGDAERAIEICRHHVPQQPGYISGHIVLGQALFDTGQFDEARGAFETALGLDPENLIALRQLGDIARETGDLEGAGSWYRRLLEVDPQNEEVAEQLQALDAASPPLPAVEQGGASDDQEQVRWGDIHPEDVPREVESAQAEAPDDDAPSDSTPLPFIVLEPEPEAGAVAENAASGDEGTALPTSNDGDAITTPASMDAEIVLDTSAIQETAPAATPEPPVIDIEALAPAIDMAAPAAEGDAGEPGAAPTSAAGEADEQAFTSSAADSSEADAESIEGESADSATGDAFVTETMAELYVRQGFIEKALDIYRQLARQSPDEPRFQSAVEELEQVLAAGAGQAMAAMEEYDAIDGAPTSVGPTIREFLSGIAARRATVRANGATSGPVSGGMASADTTSRRDDGPGAADATDATAYLAAHHDDASGTSAVYDVDRAADHDFGRAADHDFDRSVATLPSGHLPPDDELFPGRQVSPHDDAAADALASGYLNGDGAEDGRRGAPARTAADELSLDAVFRSMPAGQGDGQRESSVSFDEFFANGTPASDDGVPPLNGVGPSAESTGAPSDLELFHAWLEGLKK
ncbi:MAG TPA: tetratricopeptide repeat protein [Gemmatimonadaceae bacterium]